MLLGYLEVPYYCFTAAYFTLFQQFSRFLELGRLWVKGAKFPVLRIATELPFKSFFFHSFVSASC
jgi:hypothetical protein